MRIDVCRCLSALILAVGLTPMASAESASTQEPPEAQTVLDQHMADMLKEIHNRGADLYNSGDVAGCYRLFQGALMAVKPLLDHHAEVQKAIAAGLSSAETQADMRRRAFTLHRLIEEVRTQLKPPAKDK